MISHQKDKQIDCSWQTKNIILSTNYLILQYHLLSSKNLFYYIVFECRKTNIRIKTIINSQIDIIMTSIII